MYMKATSVTLCGIFDGTQKEQGSQESDGAC